MIGEDLYSEFTFGELSDCSELIRQESLTTDENDYDISDDGDDNERL